MSIKNILSERFHLCIFSNSIRVVSSFFSNKILFCRKERLNCYLWTRSLIIQCYTFDCPLNIRKKRTKRKAITHRCIQKSTKKTHFPAEFFSFFEKVPWKKKSRRRTRRRKKISFNAIEKNKNSNVFLIRFAFFSFFFFSYSFWKQKKTRQPS